MADRPAQPDLQPTLRVLLVEPDAEWAERLRGHLAVGRRFEVAHAPKLTTALALAGESGYDCVLLDLAAAGDGESAIRRLRRVSRLPVVGISDGRDANLVVDALRHGAYDCLHRRQVDAGLLVRTLIHAVERHQLDAELDSVRQRERYLATHDPLTGLPNRFCFEEHLQRAMETVSRNRTQLAVLFIGLDRFRTVNDTSGHAHGDELLTQVAGRLRSSLRRADLVARVGGDEFIVLLDDIPRGQAAAKVAAKLRDGLEAAHLVGDREFWVGASIGIALFPRDGSEPGRLIGNAYTAMREAKEQGGDQHRFFSHAMNETNRKRMQLETRLRKALEHDELELHYQPKVEIETGRITGAEALLRWTDPELGLVPPKEVIPVAEETGLIADLGEWSLRTACAQTAEWHREGFTGLRMSVNLSPSQIVDDGLREAVVRALWDTGLEPSRLELELTEGVLIANEEVAVRLLEDLKRVGVMVSLDDFGTGFSSLSYLKRFPVDILKIDQSFVRDIAIDPDDAAIVKAIISIAENLELGVIAEGVETEQQRSFLRARGCPEMQGFLMSPAVPPDEFLEMLRKQPPFEE